MPQQEFEIATPKKVETERQAAETARTGAEMAEMEAKGWAGKAEERVKTTHGAVETRPASATFTTLDGQEVTAQDQDTVYVLDEGRAVRYAPGNAESDANGYVALDGGVILAGQRGASDGVAALDVNRRVVGAESLSIEKRGAVKGDPLAATANTAAILDAIDRVGQGDAVYVPEGIFYVDPFEIRKSVHVRGPGTLAAASDATGGNALVAVFAKGTRLTGFKIDLSAIEGGTGDTSMDGLRCRADTEVTALEVVGPGDDAQQTQRGFYAEGCDVTFRQCVARRCADGFHVRNHGQFRLHACKTIDHRYKGLNWNWLLDPGEALPGDKLIVTGAFYAEITSAVTPSAKSSGAHGGSLDETQTPDGEGRSYYPYVFIDSITIRGAHQGNGAKPIDTRKLVIGEYDAETPQVSTGLRLSASSPDVEIGHCRLRQGDITWFSPGNVQIGTLNVDSAAGEHIYASGGKVRIGKFISRGATEAPVQLRDGKGELTIEEVSYDGAGGDLIAWFDSTVPGQITVGQYDLGGATFGPVGATKNISYSLGGGVKELRHSAPFEDAAFEPGDRIVNTAADTAIEEWVRGDGYWRPVYNEAMVAFSSGYLPPLVTDYDGAGSLHLAGNGQARAFNGARLDMARSAISVQASGGQEYIDVPAPADSIGLIVDTSAAKTLVLERSVVGGDGGRIAIAAFDSTGTQLGETGWVSFSDGDPDWVSSHYDGSYRTDRDVGANITITLDAAVEKVYLFMAGGTAASLKLRQWRLSTPGVAEVSVSPGYDEPFPRARLSTVAASGEALTFNPQAGPGEASIFVGEQAAGIAGVKQAAHVDPASGTAQQAIQALIDAGLMAGA